MMSDVVWDEVMHYVDPEMDIGSYAITRASNPVCLGSEALGSRNLCSEAPGKALDKALDEDLGKALGNRNPNSKALEWSVRVRILQSCTEGGYMKV